MEIHIITGNLGNDPDLRYTETGKSVCSFSLAVNDRRGETESTNWYKVTCWDKLAEIVHEHMKKGQKVEVVGYRLAAKAFTNKHGEPQVALELTADKVEFLSPKANGESDSGWPADPAA